MEHKLLAATAINHHCYPADKLCVLFCSQVFLVLLLHFPDTVLLHFLRTNGGTDHIPIAAFYMLFANSLLMSGQMATEAKSTLLAD
jgi:hypothetical protein